MKRYPPFFLYNPRRYLNLHDLLNGYASGSGPLVAFGHHRSSVAQPTLPRSHPRQEPSAVIPLAGICAGGGPSP
jgi:hypothetical protein